MGRPGSFARRGKPIILEMDLRTEALAALAEADPDRKCRAVQALQARAPDLPLAVDPPIVPALPLPARPERPRLVPPARVPRRPTGSREGRAALMHAVAHIEFNAINLALDAVWRFPGLPPDFYRDWLGVAAEEAGHFLLVRGHLRTLGHEYGDFDAHDGLWTMVERTAGDLAARMALVPRTMEARGLDVTPPMQARLAQAGDHAAVAVLDVILHDEVGHVALGNRWYRWLCARDGLDPETHARALAARHRAPRPKGPFNLEARRRAGFGDAELRAMLDGDADR